MGCLLVLLGAFAPRVLFLIIWIARPAYVDAVFDTFILPGCSVSSSFPSPRCSGSSSTRHPAGSWGSIGSGSAWLCSWI